MSEVIYSGLRHQSPPQLQKRQELQKSKRKGPLNFGFEDSLGSSSWKFIALILVIICLMLLLSVGILATKLSQNLANTERHPENETVWKYPTCSINWHQHGENCFLFSRTKNLWNNCPGFCSTLNSTFVKLDTDEEVTFVMKLSNMHSEMHQKFFIGLYYSSILRKWFWLDSTAVNLKSLKDLEHINADHKCMQIKYSQISAEDCQIQGYCICKKKIHSGQKNNGRKIK